jgi:hypothetical protein
MVGIGRYCCKSRKSPGDNFPAKGRRDRRPSISVLSIALPRSPVSLRSGDKVPHIFTRMSRLQPRDFLISSAKRLLQQYRPVADARVAGTRVRNWIKLRHQSQARLTAAGGSTVARIRRPLPRKAAVAADMVRLPPVTRRRSRVTQVAILHGPLFGGD